MSLKWLLSAIAIGMGLFHLYVGFTGLIQSYMLRLIHLLFALVILTLQTLRVSGKDRRKRDLVLAAVILVPGLAIVFVLWNYDYYNAVRFAYVTSLAPLEITVGVLFALSLLVAVWRTLGIAFTLLAALFLAYPFIGPYLPGFFHHNGYSLSNVVDNLLFTPDGVFGIPLGVSASFVVLFIIFGCFIEKAGLARMLSSAASGTVGRRPGGAAQMAVVLSGGIGMVSGSAVGNVLTTGTVTIPTMKRLGYHPTFAGAVEAAASSGGQITPPLMGAQAFIMAEVTGVPYITIVRYSVLPALLYYVGLFIGIDLEARRLRMKGLPPEAIPRDWLKEFLKQAYLLVPLVLLVWLLIEGYTPIFSVTYGIAALVGIMVCAGVFSREIPLLVRRLFEGLETAGKVTVPVAAASAGAGMIVGASTLTNLGYELSGAIVDLAGGSIPVALVFTMVVAIIIGMGLPTIPAYIVQLALVIPGLVKLGVPVHMAHLFVIYYSAVSMITPPVCIAAYAAAALSGAGPMRTGWLAARLGAAAYLVPFLFVFHPGLLLTGSVLQVLADFGIGVLAVFCLGVASVGHLIRPIRVWQRLAWGVCAVLLVPSDTFTIAGGALLLIGLLALHWLKLRLDAKSYGGEPRGFVRFL